MDKHRLTPVPLLTRDEVSRAVERRNPPRIPLVYAKWWGEGLREQYGDRLNELERYPDDIVWLWTDNPVSPGRMNLSWSWKDSGAHDSKVVIDDWGKLDEFIEKLPKAKNDPCFEQLAEAAERGRAEDRYVMFAFWNLFFEKPWGLRGMQNLMVDYCAEPDNIHRLHSAMAGTYCDYIAHAAKVLRPDALWTSDDLGHQTGPMMSPAIFHDMIFPYYKRVGAQLAKCKMHFWLHSCGCNTPLLPDLVDAGLTVFHPVQKYTMDEKSVASEFGEALTFLAGIDVQHTLQEKSPAGVREEVRFLIDTFDRRDGGLCLAAGNGIVRGTPFENIEAFLDEAVRYGAEHRRKTGPMRKGQAIAAMA